MIHRLVSHMQRRASGKRLATPQMTGKPGVGVTGDLQWIMNSPAWANGLLGVSPQFTGLLEKSVWVVAT